ncbi:hypothetical protein PMIN01_05923 [Paraphaeosphaeria minitans]|uniref:Uncharacterized protein n=1 Tax=Paraphaeosphaeria minitans TaxID=565426 RepID=A0A9P6GII4_9PLEO|nr:hypothetical protein PMIN01_05923 [Paraphaeosphaeria minitans]
MHTNNVQQDSEPHNLPITATAETQVTLRRSIRHSCDLAPGPHAKSASSTSPTTPSNPSTCTPPTPAFARWDASDFLVGTSQASTFPGVHRGRCAGIRVGTGVAEGMATWASRHRGGPWDGTSPGGIQCAGVGADTGGERVGTVPDAKEQCYPGEDDDDDDGVFESGHLFRLHRHACSSAE